MASLSQKAITEVCKQALSDRKKLWLHYNSKRIKKTALIGAVFISLHLKINSEKEDLVGYII